MYNTYIYIVCIVLNPSGPYHPDFQQLAGWLELLGGPTTRRSLQDPVRLPSGNSVI